MQENNMYVRWFENQPPQSTEYDFEEMWNKQEAFAESELGEVYHAIKEELEDE